MGKRPLLGTDSGIAWVLVFFKWSRPVRHRFEAVSRRLTSLRRPVSRRPKEGEFHLPGLCQSNVIIQPILIPPNGVLPCPRKESASAVAALRVSVFWLMSQRIISRPVSTNQ